MWSDCCCYDISCPKPTRICRKISAATFVRLLYLTYVVVAFVLRLSVLKRGIGEWMNFFLIGGVILMIAEALYTNIKRKGQEGKWFTPSALIFLIAVVPSIFDLQANLNQGTSTTSGVEKDMALILVQGMMILLVLGKWIAPKGQLNRNELSQLLLALLCAGADIVDFIGAVGEVKEEKGDTMKIVIMVIACISTLQFGVVFTAVKTIPRMSAAPISSSNTRANSAYEAEKQRRPTQGDASGSHHPHHIKIHFEETVVAEENDSPSRCCRSCFCFYNEIWGMAFNVILLEFPFLLMRLILIFGGFVAIDSTIIFFSFKNILTILLTINRIRVIIRNEYEPWKQQMKEVRAQVRYGNRMSRGANFPNTAVANGTSLGVENPALENYNP